MRTAIAGLTAWLLTAGIAGVPHPAGAQTSPRPTSEAEATSAPRAADAILATLDEPQAGLVKEVLDRNPDLARLRELASAADQRAPQVKSLPDPMAMVTAFLMTPETRVGPQQASAAISQRLPWFGTLALREQRALYQAAASHAEIEALRLQLVTEARRLYYELSFLRTEEGTIRSDRATLEHYEELARTRYASGVGLEQAVIKIQAEISQDDNRLLKLAEQRAGLMAALNRLRDRPAESTISLQVPTLDNDEQRSSDLDLRALALDHRPEIVAARARISAAATGIDLAEKAYRPDLSLGLGYTLVGPRDDPAGRAMPPPGNGNDIVALTVGFSLPVRRARLAAAVEEATSSRRAAEEGLRSVSSEIERSIGDLTARVTFTRDQFHLFDSLLITQAQESLRSAEAAYAAGALGALDLLDAERTLLQVRIAADRTRTDYWIALARLEGAVGAPLSDSTGRSDS